MDASSKTRAQRGTSFPGRGTGGGGEHNLEVEGGGQEQGLALAPFLALSGPAGKGGQLF